MFRRATFVVRVLVIVLSIITNASAQFTRLTGRSPLPARAPSPFRAFA